MSLPVQPPLTYLITSGATTPKTTPASAEFAAILKLVAAGVGATVSLIQLREKQLAARVLFELTAQAAQLTRGSQTRLLVNDRADVARAAGADGVHLTALSLPANVVRQAFGPDFLIGVSTHSHKEAANARADGADFAVWGPVFATASKSSYGQPQGIVNLAEVVRDLAPFPILALGGVTLDNAAACIKVGARGIAGISLFNHQERLAETIQSLNELYKANDVASSA